MEECIGIKMEIVRFEHFDFIYSGSETKALSNINLSVKAGDIMTLCGASGSGKSTLLRNMKSILMPFGDKYGKVLYKGRLLEDVPDDVQVREIGFVSQSPDNQIVTDKVYHELAFGLENLGCDNKTIRMRVGEMATFFGITDWFYKDVNQLSGGQKQIVCLASIMTMQPEIIILDEPTSQLDTIAAGEFINMLLKINSELGTTIIITEHRLDEILPYSNRVAVMEEGSIIAEGTPKEVCLELKNKKHKMFLSMPVPVRIWNECEDSGVKCPVTINEGRKWLKEYLSQKEITVDSEGRSGLNGENNKVISEDREEVLSSKNIWFKYEKNDKDVLKGVNVSIKKGEIYGILGGNGAGKSTLLSVLCGVKKPYRGKVNCRGRISMLPQEPCTLFVKKTVEKELDEVIGSHKVNKTSEIKRESEISTYEINMFSGIMRKCDVIKKCRLENILERNPYDISGGEQQRVALAKVLLTNPDIILLDEPTKGLDNEYKSVLGKLLKSIAMQGTAIVVVSHDIEFCGEWTDRCGLFFDGNIISDAGRREFFLNNSFYTTAANRMSRNIIDNVIVPKDITGVFGKESNEGEGSSAIGTQIDVKANESHKVNSNKVNNENNKISSKVNKVYNAKGNKSRMDKRFLMAALMIVIAIPFTIYAGIFYFDDRKYLFISMLILLESITPFFLIYEGRNPSARMMVTISVICAISIAGRIAFYSFPQFKPVMAIVILAGVTLGSEVGFLVGAVTMLVSNIIFGQGPWTPWQMFTMGIIGFLAGLLFFKGNKGNSGIARRLLLSLYGLIAAVVIYGGIMNPSAAIMSHATLNKATLISYYIAGLPMDLTQGVITGIYILFLARPVEEKIQRIKVKYGL